MCVELIIALVYPWDNETRDTAQLNSSTRATTMPFNAFQSSHLSFSETYTILILRIFQQHVRHLDLLVENVIVSCKSQTIRSRQLSERWIVCH